MRETIENLVEPTPEDISRIYQAAYSLLSAATAFSHRAIDPLLAEETLMRAADTVVEKLKRGEIKLAHEGQEPSDYNSIRNLPAYLFAIYKYALLNELRKKREEPLSDELLASITNGDDPQKRLEAKILMTQIMESLDAQSRLIFDCLALGYSYKEIAEKFKEQMGITISDNALRVKYRRLLARLNKVFA